jgi:hypothetical protein
MRCRRIDGVLAWYAVCDLEHWQSEEFPISHPYSYDDAYAAGLQHQSYPDGIGDADAVLTQWLKGQ